MPEISLRFYAELNDFLPPELRQQEITHEFDRRTSIKDMIEAFGVPHTEIEIILVDGKSVDFSHIVQDGEQISVYPVFEGLDVTPLLQLRPAPLREPRFILDANLGRLARYLRLLGFDCLYCNDLDDRTIAETAQQEKRTVLTRDRALLQHRIIDHGYFVREVRPRRQVSEVLARFDLYRLVQPFSRCTRCNGPLQAVDKADILERLEPKTKRYYETFSICRDCGQLYWQGSHYERSMKLVRKFMEDTRE